MKGKRAGVGPALFLAVLCSCLQAQAPLPASSGGEAETLLAASPGAPERVGPTRTSYQQQVVETVAGPGFCPGDALVDPASKRVFAADVGEDGTLLFDSGPAREGVVVKVEASGVVSTIDTGIPRGDRVSTASVLSTLPGPGRLAADGEGGFFVSAGAKLLHFGPTGELQGVIGEAGSRPGQAGAYAAGDGEDADKVRFVSARSLASDELGNLYIADLAGLADPATKIRLFNRTQGPLDMQIAGNTRVTIPPGRIDTIATIPAVAEGVGWPDPSAVFRHFPPLLSVAQGRLYLSMGSPSQSKIGAVLRVMNLTASEISAHGLSLAPGASADLSLKQDLVGRGIKAITGIDASRDGRLFIADGASHRVFALDPQGRLSVFAGDASLRRAGPRAGFDGNYRPSKGALLRSPYDVDADASGRVYVSDRLNSQMRVVELDETIRPARGNGATLAWTCRTKDASAARAPKKMVSEPGGAFGIAEDHGEIYFTTADAHRIKKVAASGSVLTAAGGTSRGGKPCVRKVQQCRGFHGDGKPATRALLQFPSALASRPGGGIYVFDAGNQRVRFLNTTTRALKVHSVTVAPGFIATVAGGGRPGAGGDGGPALRARLGWEIPSGGQPIAAPLAGLARSGLVATADAAFLLPSLGALAADSKGNLYLADTLNHRVRRVDKGGIITTVAGEGGPGRARDCCRRPVSLAADRAGNLFVGDLEPDFFPSPRVWFINRQSRSVLLHGKTTEPGGALIIAGNGRAGAEGDGGPAASAELFAPWALAAGPGGELYISTGGNIRMVDRAGIIRAVAGTGSGGFNGDGLPAALTSFHAPSGLALDKCGDLLIADPGSDRIRRVNVGRRC